MRKVTIDELRALRERALGVPPHITVLWRVAVLAMEAVTKEEQRSLHSNPCKPEDLQVLATLLLCELGTPPINYTFFHYREAHCRHLTTADGGFFNPACDSEPMLRMAYEADYINFREWTEAYNTSSEEERAMLFDFIAYSEGWQDA